MFCENSSRLLAVNYFRKTHHLRFLAEFWIRFWTFLKNYFGWNWFFKVWLVFLTAWSTFLSIVFYTFSFSTWELLHNTLKKMMKHKAKVIMIMMLSYRQTCWNFWINKFPVTHFMPLISFYTPWKHQKTSGFLMFSGDIERD